MFKKTTIKVALRFWKKYSLAPLFTSICIACSPGLPPEDRIEVAINGIHSGALSDSGEYAVVGSVQHGGSLWQLGKGKLDTAERLYNWNHQATQNEPSVFISADIDPSEQWALTAEAHTMVLWNITSGEAARFWSSPGEVLDADLSLNGRYALLGLADHSAVIFDVIKGGIVRTFNHGARVRSVDISNDGAIAITGSEDQTAIIWQAKTGEKLSSLSYSEDVQHVSLSPNGRLALIAAKYDRAELWDVEKKRSLHTLPLSKERMKRGLQVSTSRFNTDGSQILIGYTNRQVELWDTTRRELIKQWQLSKRHAWQPTGVIPVALSFVNEGNSYLAMGSNGFIYTLK